jgi:N4-gp56 family major capsid protein
LTSPTKLTAANVGEYYDRLLLDNLYPNLYFYQLAEKRRVPRGTGKVVHWTRYYKSAHGFATPYAITDGTPIGLSTLSTAQVSATLAGYGTAVGISDFIVMAGVSDVVKGAVFELSKSMALAIDTTCRALLSAGGTQTYAAGATALTQMSLCATQSLINAADLMRVVSKLRQSDARTFSDGYYATIMHPRIAWDLRQDATAATTNWFDMNAGTASGQQKLYHGEIGTVYGTRVIESSNAKQVSTTSSSLYRLSIKASGFVTTTIAPGAFGVVELDGASASVFVKQPGSAGTGDPINQLGSVGVKTYFAAAQLDTARCIRFATGGKSL